MSKKLLEYVTNKAGSTEVDAAWIRRYCRAEFKDNYWAEIDKKLSKLSKDHLEKFCLQVAPNTPKKNNMLDLLNTPTNRVMKRAGQGPPPIYGVGVDDGPARHFVDALYMLDGPEPHWELFRHWELQWAGTDGAFPYFAKKFTSDHVVKDLPGAITRCNVRRNHFQGEGAGLPENLHFLSQDAQLQVFHTQVKDDQLLYKEMLKDLEHRYIRNKGHQVNRILMLSNNLLNTYVFTRNAAGNDYNHPAAAVQEQALFVVQPYQQKFYVYHLEKTVPAGTFNPPFPLKKKQTEIKGKHLTLTYWVEYQRP